MPPDGDKVVLHKEFMEMAAAARIEAASSRRRIKDQPTVKLTKGRTAAHQGNGYAYYFAAPRGFRLADRDLLIRAASKEWLRVVELTWTDKTLQVVTAEALQVIANDFQAELCEDEGRSWEVLAKQMELLASTGDKGRVTRPIALISRRSTRVADFQAAIPWAEGGNGKPFNPAQQDAVRRAMASEITFIWGPPGTGKTDVVSAIVEGSVRQGKRVLFVAPTRVAVDQALERICDRLREHPRFSSGLVRRLGEIESLSLNERYGDYILQDKVVARRTAEIDAQVQQMVQARAQTSAAIKDRERFEQLSKQGADAEHVLKQAKHAFEHHQRELAQAQPMLSALDNRIKDLAADNSIIGKLRRAGISGLEQQRAVLVRKISESEQQLAAARQVHQVALDRYQNIIAKVAEANSGLTTQSTLEQLRHRVRQLGNAITEAATHRQEIERQVAAGCQVVATTVAKAIQSRLPLSAMDIVIVDEAGMVDLPSACYLATLAEPDNGQLIFAGDFRQLPAVIGGADDNAATNEERLLVKHWLARDVFRAAGVVASDGIASLTDRRLVRLDTQYRMRRSICEVINTIAYPDAPLTVGRDETSSIERSPLLQAPLVLLDTSGHNVRGPRRNWGNEVHAAAIREIVRGLQHDKVLPARRDPERSPGDTLAIIAPYNDQVALLRSRLKERFGEGYGDLVDTVHRFQGSERPIILLDTVVGARPDIGRFFDTQGVDSQTCRLLNVAVSRARDHLVLLADRALLYEQLGPASEVRMMLDHVASHGHWLSMTDLVPIRAASELALLESDELERPAFFPADETDMAVRWDIDRATHRVDVYCAFLNGGRVKIWADTLRSAVLRGVTVTVHCRDGNQTPDNGPHIQTLAKIGCVMSHRDQMHEKVVIADDVLWHGSLNLFQHTRSTELMMRIASSSACHEVSRIVERANPTQPRSMLAQAAQGATYLNVPYAEKDEAKQLGARWDRNSKKWFVPGGVTDLTVFTRWL
ncbi:AAA domain-containing protein [Catelliglobosispora koreensis]|uniref:AAA domain-containing protein n=1 Tax=Catelliglobosispora koreensis TaxID=129052 RepID=UPI00037E2B43|nr:AAA domain-containing protein [Catelliglobosispora koreensis]